MKIYILMRPLGFLLLVAGSAMAGVGIAQHPIVRRLVRRLRSL